MWVLFIRKHWYCNIHCFDVMLIFPNWYSPCIPPWLKLFNVTIVNVLHSKYRYAIKFILKCTSHGGMYLEKLAQGQNRFVGYFSRKLFAKHPTLCSLCRIFSSRLRSRIIQILSILFIVVIVISILLKTLFWQTSIHSQSLVKML